MGDYYLSNFDTHAFLLDTKPTTTAAALTGEIDSINTISGGSPTVNIKENYHIDGDGYASKTPLSRNVEDIEINFDRKADAVYSPSGTDVYSRFRNWTENNISQHKWLVIVYYRGKSSDTDIYEGVCYDVSAAGFTDDTKDADNVQSSTFRMAVSGGRINVTIAKTGDNTFTVALPST